jgi:hypothetical protein
MQPEIGMTLEFTARSGYGRQLISAYGNIWVIQELARVVPHDTRSGDWAKITPINGSAVRWVLLSRDNDFTLLGVKN